jgi:hypothetical protein
LRRYDLVVMHLMMPDRATATRFLREKEEEQGRSSHSFTSQLNLSAFCGIGVRLGFV